jgi:hypothetical protein
MKNTMIKAMQYREFITGKHVMNALRAIENNNPRLSVKQVYNLYKMMKYTNVAA